MVTIIIIIIIIIIIDIKDCDDLVFWVSTQDRLCTRRPGTKKILCQFFTTQSKELIYE